MVRAVAPDAQLIKAPAPLRARKSPERGHNEEGWFSLTRVMGLKFRWPGSGNEAETPPVETRPEHVIPIRGIKNDLPVSFAEGGAVPGDRIVGVMTPGDGIRIFQIHSPKLAEFEHERWIDVTWDLDADNRDRFPARMNVTVVNEPGTLAQIARVIGEEDGNIDNLRMVRRAPDYTDMLIEVEVWDLAHLNRIISGLKSKPVVSKVERSFD